MCEKASLKEFPNLPFEMYLLLHSVSKLFFYSIFTGWWRSYYGIPPDISIKEHQWCLGLHQWHVQASIAQLWLRQHLQGTCPFLSSSSLQILITFMEHSKYHTQTCDTMAGQQDLWHVFLKSLCCVTRRVPCAWCLEVRLSCIWQGKCVFYQHASERIHNTKGCVSVLTGFSNNPKK